MGFLKTLLATTLGVFIALFVFMILSIGLIVAIAASATSSSGSMHVPDNAVLKVAFKGPIPEQAPDRQFAEIFDDEGHLSLREYLAGFEQAAEDDRIAGLALELGSFGGSWAQAEEIRAKILDVRKAGKFVYATGGESGYSERDYYIASAADTIILNPAGQIEINGIYATLTFFKPMMDKLGVEANVVRAGSYKSAVEPFVNETASPENLEMTQSVVNDIFGTFRQTVREARKLTEEQLETILTQHSLVTAEEARRLGLIDAVLYNDEVEELILKRSGRKPDTKRPTIDFDNYTRTERVEIKVGSGSNNDNEIAVVFAEGSITSGESGFSPQPMFGGQQVGSETFIEAIREARDSKDVKAIVVRINSPGGSADASVAMWREVKLAAAKKPLIVSMGSLAASGGYYIAAPADTIVADPGTLTGSIGVFGLWFNLKKLMSTTIGINTQVVKSSPNADMMSAAESPTDLERAIIERKVDTTYQHFLAVVAEGRGLPIDSVRRLAEGRVWTGRQAKANGLVDVLGGLDRAVIIAAERAGLEEGEYVLRELPRDNDFIRIVSRILRSRALSVFTGSSDAATVAAAVEALEGQRGVHARMVELSLR